jgi:hypothetical protein
MHLKKLKLRILCMWIICAISKSLSFYFLSRDVLLKKKHHPRPISDCEFGVFESSKKKFILSLFILIQGKSQKIKKHLKEKIKVNKY